MTTFLSRHAPVRWLLYLSYAVLLTGALLWFRFPGVKFRTYSMQRVERFLPGTECTLGPIRYVFPISLRIDGVGLAETGRGKMNFVILDHFVITPDWTRPGKEFTFEGKAYSGKFRGRIRIDRSAKKFSVNNLEIGDFDLSAMTYIQEKVGRKVTGMLAVDGSYEALFDQPLNGVARGNVAVNEGSVGLLQPVLTLSSIDLDRVHMEFQYENATLQLLEGELQGDELFADFAGTVKVVSPWSSGKIQIAGDLLPQTQFLRDTPVVRRVVKRLQQQYRKEALPFRISGTLGQLKFGFEN